MSAGGAPPPGAESTVAIIGSGIVGTAMAHTLAGRGHDVVIFEKGAEYPYPHDKQFLEEIHYLYKDPRRQPPRDVKNLTQSGDYSHPLNDERWMVVGGSATRWQAITLRMQPTDFRTRSLYRYGADWPLGYDELEPYYGKAEMLLGVSGTDSDNPFAAPRSTSYPLPPFELSFDDRLLASRLAEKGIVVHTTPQARTRRAFEGRAGCANFGVCHVCPIGARYSPNYHLDRALETGLCRLRTNVTVRRVDMERSQSKRTLYYQSNDSKKMEEHSAKVIILAAGAIESTRLMLLSTKNEQIGRNFTLHHMWRNLLRYDDRLYPGRIGGWTGQSHQFLDPPSRGRHGAIKVEFSSHAAAGEVRSWGPSGEILDQLEPRLHTREIAFSAETVGGPRKHVTLSDRRDRFGDPYAHVHYESSEFDYETHRFAQRLNDRFVAATRAAPAPLDADANRFGSGDHHMGGCGMGHDPGNSVVDPFGAVHGTENLFIAGGSTFAGTSGAVNPTLTMVALGLRTADFISDRVL